MSTDLERSGRERKDIGMCPQSSGECGQGGEALREGNDKGHEEGGG